MVAFARVNDNRLSHVAAAAVAVAGLMPALPRLVARRLPFALATVAIVASGWSRLPLAGVPAFAQARPAVVTSPRIYVFDNGMLNVTDPKSFGFTASELKETRLIVVSYLIVHPKGTLMFDAGLVPDAAFVGKSGPVVEGNSFASRPLLPQLAAVGYRPADVTCFALSHYHGDHTANASAFAGSTWIVQRLERDAMFSDKTEIINRENFSALKTAKARVLDNEDLDVFGDGTVVLKSAPGHTPGHQVLFVKLAERGPVLLAGDLYHYPEERATGRTPTFEFDRAQTMATRAKIDAFLKQTGAQLWIEHDLATHATLPFAPGYLE
jgi:glyoxylase-like metal-dependent hydrolase (beta-lactamase superfamily II)